MRRPGEIPAFLFWDVEAQENGIALRSIATARAMTLQAGQNPLPMAFKGGAMKILVQIFLGGDSAE